MTKTVAEIRQEIDTLDNKLHDLLMKRADLVLAIGEEKRKSGVQIIQPDREIVMLRRLLGRHKGLLPKEAIVRIWRELVGAVSLLQTGLKVAVYAPDDASGVTYWDRAKDYFSSVLPMQKVSNVLAALAAVRESEATFAVVPWPEDSQPNPWWAFLLEENGAQPLRIIARLPLGDRSAADGGSQHKSLAVARLRFDASGADRSFIALEVPGTISRARVVDKAKEIGFAPISLHSAERKGAGTMLHLMETGGYVAPDDERLGRMLEKLEYPEGKCLCVGGYPEPPVYDDKVGKNAPGSAVTAAAPATKKKASS
jgi:chorismate mutase-like protein